MTEERLVIFFLAEAVFKADVLLYVGPGSWVRCGRYEGEGSHEDLAACAAPSIQHLRQDQSCAALYLQPWRYIILP